MKKLLLLLLSMFLISISAQAQVWGINESKDDFGDLTGDKYGVVVNVPGTFSNSATTNSKLTAVTFFIDNASDMYIKLLEYGSHKVSFSDEFGKLKIKDDAGNIHSIKCFQSPPGLWFSNKYRDELVNLLKTNNKLKCYYVEYSKYGSSSTYKFTLTGNGFTKVYNKLTK